MLIVTGLYAGLFGLILIWLSVLVIKERYKKHVLFGDKDDFELTLVSRAHGNFTEYVPMFLILLALLESANVSWTILHILGIVFLVSRISHAYSVLNYNVENKTLAFRGIGIVGSLIVIGLASAYTIYIWSVRMILLASV